MIKLTKTFNSFLGFISKKIGMNIRHLFSWSLSKLYSNDVDDNLMVFGSTNGDSFSGNSRDLFLYLNEYSNYHCIWFTSSPKILKELNEKKFNVVLKNKLFRSVKILKAAKYIFITHGFGDILLVDFSPDTTVVHLDHGSALKLIGHGLKETFLNSFQKRVHEYWNKRISFLTVTSEETKRTKRFSYNLPPEKVLITGYPRNEILVKHNDVTINKIKESLKLEEHSEVILYAPTFRDYKHINPLNDKFLINLDRLLVKGNKIFLYKPHPFEHKIDLSSYQNIISIDPNIDIRDLLVIADLLITDYSGVFYDYLLTMRPVIFFPYDLEKYIDVRDFFYDYEKFVPGPIVRKGEELILKLNTIHQWDQEYLEIRKKTRDKFNKYHDGNAIKRIVEFFDLKLIEERYPPIKYPEIIIEKPIGRLTSIFNIFLEFISKKIGMNLKHLFSYAISKLYSNSVSENLLVFGSTNGQAFAGNSKILFQYLTKHSNYHCVWITASEKVFNDLKKQKYQVVLNKNLIETIRILKAAKYIFITHGFGDIFFIDFSPKTKLIHLGHGISFKKGGQDLKEDFMPFTEKMINKKLVESMSLLVDSSEETKRHKLTRFNIASDRVMVTGYPRNDILANHTKDLENRIKKRLNISKNSEVILYAPTFRDYEYKIPLNETFLDNLDNFLINKNKILIYKPHPFTEDIDLGRYNNILSVKRNVDIMDLLIIADTLITDYSSVFYDYLLTLRPMIFFADDLEKYTEIRDFYYDYESFVPGPIVKTGKELIEVLDNIEKWNQEYKDKRRIMRDKFNKYTDGRSTERIIENLNLKTF
jgi:CDP-glycerol glycerophosphotransferase